MNGEAVFSPSGVYRYQLRRWWVMPTMPARWVLWVMLNPSTADASIDDRTIGRCIGFSRGWGYDGLMVGNLFGYRATDPDTLHTAPDPVGSMNDVHLRMMASLAGLVICGWGSHKAATRARVVEAMQVIGRPAHCLGLTKGGQPLHPLYLPGDLKPVPFNRA